jgi:CRISPR/Cas system endoribonuclease Cas6 (RAMP superfamily)
LGTNPTAVIVDIDLKGPSITIRSIRNDLYFLTYDNKQNSIFDNAYDGHSKILQFGLDCGLGELNSVGFGFMNLVREGVVLL